MKRTMFVMVVMAVVMGISTRGMAAYSPRANRSFRSYGYGYVYRDRRPVIVDIDYGYSCYGYGWYGRGNAQNSYPSGSLLSGLLGVPSYNEEQYWAYQNRILDLGEKGLNPQSDDQPYVKDQKLLSEANQRGKLQKLEDENQKLKEKITEMEQRLNQLAEKGK